MLTNIPISSVLTSDEYLLIIFNVTVWIKNSKTLFCGITVCIFVLWIIDSKSESVTYYYILNDMLSKHFVSCDYGERVLW